MAPRGDRFNRRRKHEQVKKRDVNDAWKTSEPGLIVAPDKTVLTNKLVQIVMGKLKEKSAKKSTEKGEEKQTMNPLKLVVVVRNNLRAQEVYGLIDKERLLTNTVIKLTDTNTQEVLICNKFDVVIVTLNFFEHCLDKSYVKLSDFPLILFDECCHRSKKDPYKKIRHEYLRLKLQKKRKSNTSVPKIIGLTSKIFLDNVLDDDSVLRHLQTLCDMWDSMGIQYIKTDDFKICQLKTLQFPELEELIKNLMEELEKQLQSIAECCPKKLSQRVLKKYDKDQESYERWLSNIRTRADNSEYPNSSEVKQIASITDCLQECYWTLVACKLLMPEKAVGRLVDYLGKHSAINQTVLSGQLKTLQFPELEELIKNLMEELEKQLQSIAECCPKKLSQRVLKKYDKDQESYERWLSNIRTRADNSEYPNSSEVKQIASITDCLQECYWTLVACKLLMPEKAVGRLVDYLGKHSAINQTVLSDLKMAATGMNCNENFESLVELLKNKKSTKDLVLVENERVAVLLTSCLEMSGVKDIKTVLKGDLKSDCEDQCKVEVLCLQKKCNEMFTRLSIKEKIEKAAKVVNLRNSVMIQRFNTKFQEKLTIDDDVQRDTVTPVKQSSNNQLDANMICSHCGKFKINISELRVYKETNIICLDRNILDDSSNSKKSLVICPHDFKKEKCKNILGQRRKMNGFIYFEPCIKAFKFQTNNSTRSYKLWKDFPFQIKPMTSSDSKSIFFENKLQESDSKIIYDEGINKDIVKGLCPNPDDENDKRDNIKDDGIKENLNEIFYNKPDDENDKRDNIKDDGIKENLNEIFYNKSDYENEENGKGCDDSSNIKKCNKMRDKSLKVPSQYSNNIEDSTHIKQRKSCGSVKNSNDEVKEKPPGNQHIKDFLSEMEIDSEYFKDWRSF
ncbi:hypothetical protein Btru_026242 [Bulinus truncatus]|nr:hypothetical protein Btru_026242 [Bulinus truncatus]